MAGFGKSGSVDMLKDLIGDWQIWKQSELKYDATKGLPLELGYITTSSPPIVVNDILIVGNSAEQGYNQTRVENVPGDILGYDVKTGKFLWKFHVIPRPGEFGHETWENDAWRWTGDVSSWAPMSADPSPRPGLRPDQRRHHRLLRRLPSRSTTCSAPASSRSTSRPGKRVWHQQLVKHDIWNYDTPTAPMLMDVTVGGRRIPGLFQITKQSFVYSFNRHTGESIWPMGDAAGAGVEGAGREVVDDAAVRHQPAPFDQQGRKESDLIDFTPEVKKLALERAKKLDLLAELFEPPRHRGNAEGRGPANICPGGGGGANITGPPAADPANGIIFVASKQRLLADAARSRPRSATTTR